MTQYVYRRRDPAPRGTVVMLGKAIENVEAWYVDFPVVAHPPKAAQRATFSMWPPPTGAAPFWPNLPAYWGP